MTHQGLRLGEETVGVEVGVDVVVGLLAQSVENIIDQRGDDGRLATGDVDAVDDDIVGEDFVNAFEELVGIELSHCRTVGIRAEEAAGIAPLGHLDEEVDRGGNGLRRDAWTIAAVRLDLDGMSEEIVVSHFFVGLYIPSVSASGIVFSAFRP
jgi:hypothetical protein